MDAGFGMTLATLISGGGDEPRDMVKSLFKYQSEYTNWCSSLRKKTTLEDVEDHISQAFTGSKIYKQKSKARFQAEYTPEVRAGIRKMAISLCESEAKINENEILQQLQNIQKLREIAGENSPTTGD